MTDRTKVSVCGLCDGIFEGPRPPAVCPSCRAPSAWRPAEVGRQEGFVGGRVFVPGTDVPMTRVFCCRACSKVSITREGAEPPGECGKCGAKASDLEDGESLWAESRPQALRRKPAVASPPGPAAPRVRTTEEIKSERDARTREARSSSAHDVEEQGDAHPRDDVAHELPEHDAPRGSRSSPVVEVRAQDSLEVLSVSTREQSAQDFRAEWIAERVAEAWRSGTMFPDLKATVLQNVWGAASLLYDEGKRMGLLP